MTTEAAVTEADLTIEYMPVAELPDALHNPKAHDEDVIRASILRFGFHSPPLLDERTGRLIGGHGRKAVIAGLESEADPDDPLPAKVKLDDYGRWLIPVIRGWASADDDEAEAALLADNQATLVSGWQPTPLAERLRELHKRGRGLTNAAGFTDNDVRARVSKLNVIPPRESSQQRREPVKYRCPRCRHEGEPAEFKPEQEDKDK